MSKWLRMALLLTILGITKAHHLIRVVILAALGLAGLWMVHTLAQDYQHITGAGGGKSENFEIGKYFSKRSADYYANNSQRNTRQVTMFLLFFLVSFIMMALYLNQHGGLFFKDRV